MTIHQKKKYKFYYGISPDKCMSCAACEIECKFNAVYINDDVYYAIDVSNCTRCGKCFRACPVGAVERIMDN